jgi:hypothetical protein
MQNIKIITKVCIVIAVYYFVYYVYKGFLMHIPLDADSWDYHIPISLSILNGSFLTASFNTIPHLQDPITHAIHEIPVWYVPGSSDAINAFFILLHIPTVSNIFAAVILFFACWKLGTAMQLAKYYAILFAITITTTNVVLRWLNAVSVDVWVGVWFTLSLILLEKPKKSNLYFAKLGFVLGMLIGTKYTTLYFILVFFIFYIRNILKYCNFQRILSFLVPFSVFGLFWYIRNFILTRNPFYPVERFGFPGPDSYGDSIWRETLNHPIEMFNAIFGEYHLWLFSIVVAGAYIIYQFAYKKNLHLDTLGKMFLLGFINFICYLDMFSDSHAWIMVSVVRYSLPAFIPLILGVFMLAAQYKKEELLGYFVVANMLCVLSMGYYPKLIVFDLLISFGIFYLLDKKGKAWELKK